MVAVCSARELHLTHWNGTRALRGVSLELSPGELLAVIGPNGAGKTSLLHALAGLLPLDSGSIRVDGVALDGLSIKARARRLSLVMQGLQIPAGIAVRDLVLMARYPHLGSFSGPGVRDQELVDRCLEEVGMQAFGKRLVGELSGGERQRALLARCLAQEAPLILMDEPTTALDPGHGLGVLQHIRTLLESGRRGVLLATHDLNLASQFADRVLLLDGGQTAATGTPGEVLRPAVLEAAYGRAFAYGIRPSSTAGEKRPWVLPWLET
ncbi:MAG: ABC transporter ATP-binding protein [Planctomycetota bacterium]